MNNAEFDVYNDPFVFIQSNISRSSGEYGHLTASFSNMAPSVYSPGIKPELRITAQASRLASSASSDSPRDDQATLYGIRFGLTGEEMSLPVIDAYAKLMRKLERRMEKLEETDGRIYASDSTFTAFDSRVIKASGVKYALFYEHSPGFAMPNLDRLDRIPGGAIERIAERIAAIEGRLLQRLSHTAA